MADTGKRRAKHAAKMKRWDEMQHFYTDSNLTIKQIATRFNVSETEVSRMADERDLPLRRIWKEGTWEKMRARRAKAGVAVGKTRRWSGYSGGASGR